MHNKSTAALPPMPPEGRCEEMRVEVMRVNASRAILERELAEARSEVLDLEDEVSEMRSVAAERDKLRQQADSLQAAAARTTSLESDNAMLLQRLSESESAFRSLHTDTRSRADREAALSEELRRCRADLADTQVKQDRQLTQLRSDLRKALERDAQSKAEAQMKEQLLDVENQRLQQCLEQAEAVHLEALAREEAQQRAHEAEAAGYSAEKAALALKLRQAEEKARGLERPAVPAALVAVACDAAQVVGCYQLQPVRRDGHPVWACGAQRIYSFASRWTIGHESKMQSGGGYLRSNLSSASCLPQDATWQRYAVGASAWVDSKSFLLATWCRADTTSAARLTEVLLKNIDTCKALKARPSAPPQAAEGDLPIPALHARLCQRVAALQKPYSHGVDPSHPAVASLAKNFASAEASGQFHAQHLHVAYLRFVQHVARRGGAKQAQQQQQQRAPPGGVSGVAVRRQAGGGCVVRQERVVSACVGGGSDPGSLDTSLSSDGGVAPPCGGVKQAQAAGVPRGGAAPRCASEVAGQACNNLRDAISELRMMMPAVVAADDYASLPTEFPKLRGRKPREVSSSSSESSSPPPPPPMKSPSPIHLQVDRMPIELLGVGCL